jgi:hypothetical protein
MLVSWTWQDSFEWESGYSQVARWCEDSNVSALDLARFFSAGLR